MATTIQVPASSTLDNTNAIVAQYEQANGPLTITTNDGTYTLLSFDDAGTNPTNFAKIQASTAAPPANSTPVCVGTIFVAGTLTPCTAYRAN
jgi:hypothetical protein